MSTAITDAKVEFKNDLVAAGFDCFEYVPERINPPVLVITGNANYVTVGNITNDFVLALDLMLVAGQADNEMATEQLDDQLATLIKALPNYSVLTSVGAPAMVSANNTEYLSSTVSVELFITL